jgi:hypothetical protein
MFAGLVPAKVIAEHVHFYGFATTLKARYFKRMPHISVVADDSELPFRLEEARRLAAMAAIYALNKHEFNVSQDLALLGAGNNANAG